MVLQIISQPLLLQRTVTTAGEEAQGVLRGERIERLTCGFHEHLWRPGADMLEEALDLLERLFDGVEVWGVARALTAALGAPIRYPCRFSRRFL